MSDKSARIHAANAFLMAVATCGGRFFNHEGQMWTGRRGETHRGHISRFGRDDRGHVYLEDGYTGRHCYRRPTFRPNGSTQDTLGWYGRHFTEGGNLNQLCQGLDEFIRTGRPQRLNLGPWPEWYCHGDLWGYGDDMETVRDAARRLGVWDSSQPGCS